MKIKPLTKRSVTIEIGEQDQVLLAKGGDLALKKILVPTDFSESSKKAIKYATALAQQLGAEIEVLHVIPASSLGDYGGLDYLYLAQEVEEKAGRKLSGFLNDEIGVKAPSRAFVRSGQAAWEIVDAAKEIEADLIVIATHGRTGLKRALLGSIAEAVVRHAPCPVLTVRDKEREFLGGLKKG